MSIFENANRNVEKHNYGMNSKFDRFGRRIIDLPEKQEPVTEDITAKIIQGPDTVKPELSPGEKAYRETRVQNAINFNTKSNIMKNMHSEILNGVLENVIGSIYYDALYLDDDFKEYNSGAITESVHDFLDERGGYKYIQEAYNRTKSPLLKSIMDICEETAREVSERKVKECNEKSDDKQSLDDIKIFDMNDEEKEKLDYDKDSIGLDKISGVIKDKILNVVKEEKKREAEHVELIDEIESQLSEDEEVNDEKAVAEALSSIFVQNTNIEEGTLFNSMLRKNYKSVIESGYDSLTLSKLDHQSKLDELLNKVPLEDIVTEDELVDPKGQLITTEVKDVFNDFMDKLEREKDLGSTDSDALLEAFAACENKFYEVANSKISKSGLKAIKRDFKILQETFNEFLPVDEGAIKAAGKALDNADSALAGAMYRLITKLVKDPKKMREAMEKDRNTIKLCKAEIARRENLDEKKIKQLLSYLKRTTFYSMCQSSIEVDIMNGVEGSAENVPTVAHLKALIRRAEVYLKVSEKRLAELEGKKKKAVKESFDEFDYDLWDDDYESVDESMQSIKDDKDKNFEKNAIAAMEGKSVKQLKEALKINEEAYKSIKAEVDRREALNDNKLKKIMDTVKRSAVLVTAGLFIKATNHKYNTNLVLDDFKRFNRIMDRLLKAKIKELESGKKKSVKESFEDFEYALWSDGFDDEEYDTVIELALTDAIKKGADKAETKVIEAIYKGVIKLSKNPEKLRKSVEVDKKLIKACKAEVNDRSKTNPNALQKAWKHIKGAYYYSYCSGWANKKLQEGDQEGAKHLNNRTLRMLIKYGEIYVRLAEKRIKELESGKKSVKESFDAYCEALDEFVGEFEVVEEKNVITNNKFVDSIKDKFTPPGSSKKKDKKEEKTKATKEGVDCDNAGGCGKATKEGTECNTGECSDKKVKKIDTTFDMDAKVKEGTYEYFDIDDDLDITEEAVKLSKGAITVTAKNLGTIMTNMIKRKKDVNSIHDGLLKIVNSCKNVGEVEYLQKDIGGAKKLMRTKMERAKTAEERKMYQTHLSWIGSEYSKALSAKKKELKAKEATKNKTVKEACSDIMDECMTIIDKRLDLHEASDLNMANEVKFNYNGRTVLMPVVNKKDIQLEGLDLAYKMKYVIESLTNILIADSSDDKLRVVEKALKTNKENTKAVLEACKTIPSTPVYKINYFNTFNDLLDILTENVEQMNEVEDIIKMKEYDDSSLDIYETDYSYNVITESVNDFDINSDDEFIDMDFVLADTIAQYTLLETMYTLQLENPKHKDIKNMTNKLLNR